MFFILNGTNIVAMSGTSPEFYNEKGESIGEVLSYEFSDEDLQKIGDGFGIKVKKSKKIENYIEVKSIELLETDESKNRKITSIKEQTQEEILEEYPIRKQMNIIRDGGESLQEMNSFIDGKREECNKKESEILGN